MRAVCIPCLHAEKEVEEHSVSHIPFRAWCKHCVWGKAVEGIHRKGEEDRRSGELIVDMDYWGNRVDGNGRKVDEWGSEEGTNPR